MLTNVDANVNAILEALALLGEQMATEHYQAATLAMKIRALKVEGDR